MQRTESIPIEILRDNYAFNPFTGQLYSLYKGRYLAGKTKRAALGLSIRWGDRKYETSYGRVVFAFIYGYWPLAVRFRDGNPTNTRLKNLRAALK